MPGSLFNTLPYYYHFRSIDKIYDVYNIHVVTFKDMNPIAKPYTYTPDSNPRAKLYTDSKLNRCHGLCHLSYVQGVSRWPFFCTRVLFNDCLLISAENMTEVEAIWAMLINCLLIGLLLKVLRRGF